jgi:hypothetical protein
LGLFATVPAAMESKGEGTPLLPAATRRHDRVLLAVAVTSTFAGLYMSMSIINPYSTSRIPAPACLLATK